MGIVQYYCRENHLVDPFHASATFLQTYSEVLNATVQMWLIHCRYIKSINAPLFTVINETFWLDQSKQSKPCYLKLNLPEETDPE